MRCFDTQVLPTAKPYIGSKASIFRHQSVKPLSNKLQFLDSSLWWCPRVCSVLYLTGVITDHHLPFMETATLLIIPKIESLCGHLLHFHDDDIS